jgi:hypothetical protein
MPKFKLITSYETQKLKPSFLVIFYLLPLDESLDSTKSNLFNDVEFFISFAFDHANFKKKKIDECIVIFEILIQLRN